MLDIPNGVFDVRIGRLSLIVDHDSRDNFFTPGKGTHAEADTAVAKGVGLRYLIARKLGL